MYYVSKEGVRSMKKLVEYFKKLTQSRSSASSKRFMALSTMALIYYVVIRFTTEHNIELVLVELISFILVLCGEAIWENIKRTKT